jgi:preprotein translocase subunit SecG
MGIIIGFFWFLFVVSGLLLCVVILLQEGKGGGLAEAFGGAGAEVFGVKAGGINKLTSVLAAVFIGSIVFIDACERPTTLFTPVEQAPALPGGPGTDGGSPPPADSSKGSTPAPSSTPAPDAGKENK